MEDVDFSYKSLNLKVAEHLKNEIYLGKYKGGERLFINEIAKGLDVSVEPVRKAINILVNQGLVKKIPRKGSFVAEFTRPDVEEIFDIRVLLENRVVEILIENKILTEKDFEKLTTIVDEMVEIAAGSSPEEEKSLNISKKDIIFHRYLWEKSGRIRTMKMLANLHSQLQLVMIMDSKLEGGLVRSAEKHYSIIKHLKRGDLKNTKKAILDHIVTYKEWVENKKFRD